MVVRTQRIRLAAFAAACAALAAGLHSSVAPRAAQPVMLPSGWKITPSGTATLPLGTLPLHMAQDPSGRWLAISNAGFGDLSITIVDEQTGRVTATQPMTRTFYGLEFSPAGDELYASSAADGGVAHYSFNQSTGTLSDSGYFPLGAGKLWTNGLAVSPDGGTLYAAVAGADVVVGMNTRTGATNFATHVGDTPYTVTLSPGGAKLYAANWGSASLSVLNPTTGAVLATIDTDSHPGAAVFGADGRTLYIACANDDVVDVIDTLTDKLRGRISVALYRPSPAGATPDGLALSDDGRTLFVAVADENAVVAVDVSSTAPAVYGALPTGWYPTDVALSHDGKRLYVLDGKGMGLQPNPNFYHSSLIPATKRNADASRYYPPNTANGDLETFTSFGRNALIGGLAIARANSSFRPDYAAHPPTLPLFKHVIYVIKENRTYDEVLGDDSRGNGQASLAAFGQRYTPNIHRLADEFVLLDNFECEGTVSADGHQWSDGAYADDYMQRMWPSDYAGRGGGFMDTVSPILRPSAGYIWDLAAAHGLSVRLYGEGASADSGGVKADYSSVDPLLDKNYRPFDVKYADQDRIVEWLREFRQFEQNGALPQLEVVWLPSDHTAAMKPGARTPFAMVADNDYALGRMIEALSHSRYWRDTLLISIEDDSQAGPDHVSSQRVEALVISAYTNRGLVDHTHYSTSSALRTIEAVFGLPPLSQFDASATPLAGVFTSVPDMRPWKATLPQTALDAINPPDGPGAQASQRLDLRTADASDPAEFNRILAAYLESVKR